MRISHEAFYQALYLQGRGALIGAIQPLMVIALVWAMDRHPPIRLIVGASVLGVAGMAVLLLSPSTVWEPVGIAAALAGAACMAAGTYLTRRWKPAMPVLALTGWQLMVGGLMLARVAWMADAPLPTLRLTQMLAYAYLCIAGALLAYALWFRGIARLPSVAVSSLGLLSALTAFIPGWALLGQPVAGVSLIGLLMVFVSILTV